MILFVLLLLILLGYFGPWTDRGRGYGPYPAGIVGLVVVVLILFMLFSVVPWGWPVYYRY